MYYINIIIFIVYTMELTRKKKVSQSDPGDEDLSAGVGYTSYKVKQPLFIRLLSKIYKGIRESVKLLNPSYKAYKVVDTTDLSKLTSTELKYKKRDLKKQNIDTKEIDKELHKNKTLKTLVNTDLLVTVLAKVSIADSKMLIGYNQSLNKIVVSNHSNRGIPVWKPANQENITANFLRANSSNTNLKIIQELDYLKKSPLPKNELRQDVNTILNNLIANTTLHKNQFKHLDRQLLMQKTNLNGQHIILNDRNHAGSNYFTIVSSNEKELVLQPLLQDKNSIPVKIDKKVLLQKLSQKNTINVSKLNGNIHLGMDNVTKEFKFGFVKGGSIQWENQQHFLKGLSPALANSISTQVKSGDYVLANTVTQVSYKNSDQNFYVGIHNNGHPVIKNNKENFRQMQNSEALKLKEAATNNNLDYKNSPSDKMGSREKIGHVIQATFGDVQAAVKLARNL